MWVFVSVCITGSWQDSGESVADVGVCYVYYSSVMRVLLMWVSVLSVVQQYDESVCDMGVCVMCTTTV